MTWALSLVLSLIKFKLGSVMKLAVERWRRGWKGIQHWAAIRVMSHDSCVGHSSVLKIFQGFFELCLMNEYALDLIRTSIFTFVRYTK